MLISSLWYTRSELEGSISLSYTLLYMTRIVNSMLWFLMLAEAAIVCELPFLSMCWFQHKLQNVHETMFCINYWFGSSNVHFTRCRILDFQFHIHGSIQGRKGVWILLQTRTSQKKDSNKGLKTDYSLKLRWAEAWVVYLKNGFSFIPRVYNTLLSYTLPRRVPITSPKRSHLLVLVYTIVYRYSTILNLPRNLFI